MKWLASELHTHTMHSDGQQTLSELAAGAVKLGFDAIALTDHNTMSGLEDREGVSSRYDLFIIPGMEWTTFYGHMMTLGLNVFVDWRATDLHDMDEGIKAVHRQGGLAGLAHPFRIGSPACTGCFWEYEIEDWSVVDYIEVWSGISAPIQSSNQRAYTLWTDKLNEGYRIAATSGRDWHVQADTTDPISVTYLGITDEAGLTEEELVKALRLGRVTVTIGPLMGLSLNADGKIHHIGSVVSKNQIGEALQAKISLDFSVRPGLWTAPEGTCKLMLSSNLGTESVMEIDTVDIRERLREYEVTLQNKPRKWIRAELWGCVQGKRMLIAFTNAIYFG